MYIFNTQIKHLRTSFTVCKKKYEEVIGREEAE